MDPPREGWKTVYVSIGVMRGLTRGPGNMLKHTCILFGGKNSVCEIEDLAI